MDNKHSKIQEKLDAIRISYIASLSQKRESIETSWSNLNNEWIADTYDSLYLVIHGLAGSAETFGFPEITQQARTVVDQFKELNPHHPPVEPAILTEISEQIETLLETLRQTTLP